MLTFKLTLTSTIAAMMALLCAYALGWQHAWWAAMTVWLVIQPNRNLMTGKILARSLGSSLGGIMGAFLILFVTPLSMQLLCLGIWLLMSSGLGSLFQQYRNYAFVVAGYTAAIVLMFCYFENNADVKLAYTRIFCTFIGVFFCILWVLPFIPQQKHHHAFKNLHSIQGQIQHLFKKPSVPLLEPKIQSFYFEIKRLNQYFQFHQALTKKDNPQHVLHALIQQLSLIQAFTQPETRRYFLEKEVSSHRLPLKQRLKYFFQYFALNRRALHVLHAIVRVMGVYLLTLTLWLATDWKQAPLMVMTAILFAALFSSHAYAQHALTDVLKGSLLGAILGLILRIFIMPMHDSGWMMLALFIVLLLGAYLMNQSKTAKMAIDLNMTFLLIAQPLAQVSQQMPDILMECLAILSGITITFIWFKTAVPSLFRTISTDRYFAVKLMHALKNLTTYPEFIYLAALMRADLYTRILEQNQTSHELEVTLLVLKQIYVVDVENLPQQTFQKSGLQVLIQAVAQQHHLRYSLVQGEQSHVL